jgi:hypothetical protein
MTNEPILLPWAPHPVESEFLSLDRYRGIVAEAVFGRLGRPSYFDEAVDLILSRIAARVGQQETSAETIRGSIQLEAQKLSAEIEARFAASGKLELPQSCKSEDRI